MKLKPPVQQSFSRLKAACINNELIISVADLKSKGIINAAEPRVHIDKLENAGLISKELNKHGNKSLLTIKILKEQA